MKLLKPLLGLILVMMQASLLEAQTFRFAWMSDTHVGSAGAADDLRTSIRDINHLQGIAFAIISGDIGEMGSNAELLEAKSILDSLRMPYHIIPGNHDTKWSESGCTMFLRLWGNDRFVFDQDGMRFIGMHEGPIMRMGDGHFSPEDLRWLDSVIAPLRDSREPVVFVTHYPLDRSIDNWFEITSRLRSINTKVALFGHGHANGIYSFEGIPGIMCRSNLRARDTIGGYSVVEFRNDSFFVAEKRPGLPPHLWGQIAAGVGEDSVHALFLHPETQKINTTGIVSRWVYDSRYTITAAPVVWKDRVIVADRGGDITCLSAAEGKVLWSAQAGGPVLSTPDVYGEKVVFASTDGIVYCVRVDNGARVWSFKTREPLVAAPRISGGVVYVGGSDSTFRALDVQTGALLWTRDSIDGFVETRPLVYRGLVIFGAWDTRLYALNARDGERAWSWSNGNPSRLYSPAACWPVAADGKVFIVAPDRAMTVIDVLTGKAVWRSREHQVREAIGISVDSGRVYARCMTDTLLAYSSASATPTLFWETNCGYGYDIDPSMPVERDGIVYFGTKNGLVLAVDSATGSLRWVYKVGVTIVNTPAPLDARAVVVTDADGKVTMIGPAGR